jgi:hypothetical protein
MSHVRELHRRSIAFIQVLCRAVGLEGFRSDLGTSGIAPDSLPAGFGPGGLGTGGIVCMVWAPAVSLRWSGHAGPIISGPAISHPSSPTHTHLKGHSFFYPTLSRRINMHQPPGSYVVPPVHIMGSGEFSLHRRRFSSLAVLDAVKNLRQTRCVRVAVCMSALNRR